MSKELKEFLAALTRLVNLGIESVEIMLDEHSIENGREPKYGTVQDPSTGSPAQDMGNGETLRTTRRPGRRRV